MERNTHSMEAVVVNHTQTDAAHAYHTGDVVNVRISVKRDGVEVGVVDAAFEEDPENDGQMVADWDTTTGRSGAFEDEEPPFWPVAIAAQRLADSPDYDEYNFLSMNTGRADC